MLEFEDARRAAYALAFVTVIVAAAALLGLLS
jgi:hypothetical protein